MDFVKPNATRFTDALLREAEGLNALRELITTYGIEELHIPEVRSVQAGRLVLAHIAQGRAADRLMHLAGKGLARLHRPAFAAFGYATDNYIGRNPQCNGFSERWGIFFVERRLAHQVSLIRDSRLREIFRSVLDHHAEALAAFLDTHVEQASLAHGDLWQGNVLFGEANVWLIDPAVYYADREVDLAMSELFGGFDAAFYAAYDAEWQRSAMYPVKRVIYNLYHYLNHYNLFGAAYLGACRDGFAFIERTFGKGPGERAFR